MLLRLVEKYTRNDFMNRCRNAGKLEGNGSPREQTKQEKHVQDLDKPNKPALRKQEKEHVNENLYKYEREE